MTAAEKVARAEANLRAILDGLEADGGITDLAHIRIRTYLAPLASAAAGAAAGYDIAQRQSAERIERLSARESDDKPAGDPAPTPGRKRQRDAVGAALLDTLGGMTAGKVRALEDRRTTNTEREDR